MPGAPTQGWKFARFRAAITLGQISTFEIRRLEQITDVFEAIKGRADALYVVGDPLVDTYRVRINTFALGARAKSVRCPLTNPWQFDILPVLGPTKWGIGCNSIN